MKAKDLMMYTGGAQPFGMEILSTHADGQGMVLVRRLRDNGVCYAHPRNMREPTEREREALEEERKAMLEKRKKR